MLRWPSKLNTKCGGGFLVWKKKCALSSNSTLGGGGPLEMCLMMGHISFHIIEEITARGLNGFHMP